MYQFNPLLAESFRTINKHIQRGDLTKVGISKLKKAGLLPSKKNELINTALGQQKRIEKLGADVVHNSHPLFSYTMAHPIRQSPDMFKGITDSEKLKDFNSSIYRLGLDPLAAKLSKNKQNAEKFKQAIEKGKDVVFLPDPKKSASYFNPQLSGADFSKHPALNTKKLKYDPAAFAARAARHEADELSILLRLKRRMTKMGLSEEQQSKVLDKYRDSILSQGNFYHMPGVLKREKKFSDILAARHSDEGIFRDLSKEFRLPEEYKATSKRLSNKLIRRWASEP